MKIKYKACRVIDRLKNQTELGELAKLSSGGSKVSRSTPTEDMSISDLIRLSGGLIRQLL